MPKRAGLSPISFLSEKDAGSIPNPAIDTPLKPNTMNHEKIIKRPEGNQIKISVSITISAFTRHDESIYKTHIQTKEKGKKIWKSVINGDDYRYRALSMEDRRKFADQEYLKYASAEEILQAKTELWMKLKPA